MNLLDDIHQLQKKYADAGRYERMVLDLAASLLEVIQEESTGNPPDPVTIWDFERFELLPDTFEMLDGRVVPKHWSLYAEHPDADS